MSEVGAGRSDRAVVASAGACGDSASSRLVVFMFTDIVDSTRLKGLQEWGVAKYAEAARRHDAHFRMIVNTTRGAEILKDLGDGFMATFPTASDAVRAALRFQHAIRFDPLLTPSESMSAPGALRVRIGIHQGEVSVLDLDINQRPKLIGPAPDLAKRIESLALPGQILLSRAVFNDARQYVREHPVNAVEQPAPSLRWNSYGFYRFKGVDETEEIFEVGGDGIAPFAPPADQDKARYVGSPEDEVTRGWRPAVSQSIPGRPGWILVCKLGEGGFGEVWLAEQDRTGRRRVFKFCFETERVRSLRREFKLFQLLREALGDRPDIVKLHDFELDKPPFYLESDYSELGDLAAWAESRGGVSAVPLELRLEIVACAAEAVDAAHSVGILHKDIKPSNLLMYLRMAGEPDSVRPILADFGIGSLADKTRLSQSKVTMAGLTQTEEDAKRAGTRHYSPPESDRGLPFTISGDIYALGVLLFQVVVGDLSRPIGVGWERGVDDDDLREDIAACTDAEPSQRLASAKQLAARLRSLPDRRADRARKAAEKASIAKRRMLRRLAFVGTAALAIGACVLVVALARESTLRERAEIAERDVRVRSEELEAVSSFQAAMLSNINHTDAGRALMQELRDRYNATLSAQPDDHPERERKLATFDEAIRQISAPDVARAMINQMIFVPAIEAIEKDFQDKPLIDAALRQTIVMSYLGLGMYGDAVRLQEKAVEILRQAHPPGHQDTLAAINTLGACLWYDNRLTEAHALFKESLEGMRRLSDADPKTTLDIVSNIGALLQQQGKLTEAETFYREAIEGTRRIVGDHHPDTIATVNNLCTLLRELGRATEAESCMRGALENCNQTLGPSHPDTLSTRINLCYLLKTQGEIDEAFTLAQQTLEACLNVHGMDHEHTRKATDILAVLHRMRGDFERSELLEQEAVRLCTEAGGVRHPEVLAALTNLGVLRKSQGRLHEAEEIHSEVLAARLERYAGDHPLIVESLTELAKCLLEKGELIKAQQLAEEAVTMTERMFGPEHPLRAVAMSCLAISIFRQVHHGAQDAARPLSQEPDRLLDEAERIVLARESKKSENAQYILAARRIVSGSERR